MSFKGKIVLVTGGSSGIGASTAQLFANEGANVVIVGRNEEKLNTTAQRCRDLGATTLTIKANMAIDKEADTIVDQIIQTFGTLDVLVNNAGIIKEASILDDNFLDVYDEIVNINMRAAVRITKFAVPYIIAAKGNIINVSSVAALSSRTPNYIAYRSSKASLNHFTRALASELACHGVRVNSVSPGPVKTNLLESLSQNSEDFKESTPLHRISNPEDIAEIIVFLASDKAKSVTGANYVIDNGILLK